MNEVCCSRPLSLENSAVVVPGMKLKPSAATSFPIHYVLHILPFDRI